MSIEPDVLCSVSSSSDLVMNEETGRPLCRNEPITQSSGSPPDIVGSTLSNVDAGNG